MTETRLKVTDVAGGRANSQSGAAEIDLAVPDGTTTLELDGENLIKILGLTIQLCRLPAPIPGKTVEVRAFRTAWWTLGKTPDDREMILTFEIEGGGHIGFRIPMDQANRLYDSMAATVGRAPAPPGVPI